MKYAGRYEWSHCGYIFKVELTGLADRPEQMGMRCERRESKMTPCVLAQTTGKNALPLPEIVKPVEDFGEENQEVLLVHLDLRSLLVICGSKPPR